MIVILTSAADDKSRNIKSLVNFFPKKPIIFNGFAGKKAGINCKGQYMLGNGHTGCGLSILTVFEMFKHSKEEWLFFFESDAKPNHGIEYINFLHNWEKRPAIKVAFLQHDDLAYYRDKLPRVTTINKLWYRTPDPISFAAIAFHRDAINNFRAELKLPVDMEFLNYMKRNRVPYATTNLFKHDDSTSSTREDSGK